MGVLVGVLVAVLVACTGAAEDHSDPEAAIVGFDTLDLADSYTALHDSLEADEDGLREAAIAHLTSEDGDVRYAAVYALSLTAVPGDSAAALRPFLRSDDATERMLAAGQLSALGETDALGVLIEALDVTDTVRYRDPPQPCWEFASALLVRFTGRDLGLADVRDATDAARARPRWMAWFERNRDALEFDAGTLTYRTSA